MSIANIIESMRTNLANAYSSIEARGAKMPEEKNLENLAATINTLPEGGGSSEGGDAIINGLVESYYVYAGENINAGDFVKFAQGVMGSVEIETTETATEPIFLSGDGEGGFPLQSSTWHKYKINFIPLTETKIFIGMATYSTRSVFVMQFNDDGTITLGTKITVGQSAEAPEVLERISDNMVFAYHLTPYGANNANVEDDYFNIYRIDGTTIVKYVIKNDKTEGLVNYSESVASLKLDDHHVLLIGNLTSNEVSPLLVTFADDYSDITWSNSMVTMNNITLAHYYDTYNRCFQMSNNRVLLLTEGYTAAQGFLFEVTTDKITYLKTFSGILGNDDYSYRKVQLDDTHILYVYPGDDYQVHGCIYTLNSDNTLTKGEDYQLTTKELIEMTEGTTENGHEMYSGSWISQFGVAKNPFDNTILIVYAHNYTSYDYDDDIYLANESQMYHSICQVNDDYSLSIVYENQETNLVPSLTGFGAQAQVLVYFIGIPSSQNFVLVYDEIYDLEWPEDCEEYDSKWQCLHINNDYTIEPSYVNGGTRLMYETQVKKATTIPFDGIAKTSGVGGDDTAHKDQIEIYTLDKE